MTQLRFLLAQLLIVVTCSHGTLLFEAWMLLGWMRRNTATRGGFSVLV